MRRARRQDGAIGGARRDKVTAVDVDGKRLARVKRKSGAHAFAGNDLVEGDARDYAGTAPFVLIDAPCTATGTIRRHPDLPWIKGAADVNACASGAYEILQSGAAMVEPGGMLVFAVCSLEREEGEEQIEAFLGTHPESSSARRLPQTNCSVVTSGLRRTAICKNPAVANGRWDGRILRGPIKKAHDWLKREGFCGLSRSVARSVR